jgi:glycosyltransferase involved in cell wall biosynthesis
VLNVTGNIASRSNSVLFAAVITAEREPSSIQGDELDLVVDYPLPKDLPAGQATALFFAGTCFHRRQPVEALVITVDGMRHRPTAQRMPRPDRFRSLHPTALQEEAESLRRDPQSLRDPELRSYRSGFWATIPISVPQQPGELRLGIEARVAGGTIARAALGTIAVVEGREPPSYDGLPTVRQPLTAICMATFNPVPELFQIQVDSIRAQTHRDWICLISDDRSRPDRFEMIREAVAGDPRFVLSRSDEHLGFYRNFERALKMVPPEAELVALSDHDDRWYPEKLAVLIDAIGDGELAFSDQRLVDAQGRVRRETLWRGRRNNHTNLASLLISNTIAGAASLFRRRVIDYAVPFPSGPGWQFHDHWLALVAMTLGEVVYVDRPLYDYVQHPSAVLGRAASDSGQPRQRPRARLDRWRGFVDRWRGAYFNAYLDREVQAQVLLARCGSETTRRKRRALRLFVNAGRSPLAFAWLAARPARALLGRNETLLSEELFVRGILWRHLIALRTGRRERPGGSMPDASMPPFDPESVGSRRLRRWLTQS